MRLLGIVVKLMKRSWTCLNRQSQKVKKLSKVKKPQKLDKSAKAIGLEGPSFLTSNTRLAFTKMGSRYTKLTMEDFWPLLEANWEPYQMQVRSSHSSLPIIPLADSKTYCACSPSTTSILEMRSRKKHPNPRSAWWRRGCWGSCASPRALYPQEDSKICCQEILRRSAVAATN